MPAIDPLLPRCHCPRCAASVPVRAPRLSDRLLFALVVTTTVAMCAGAPLLGFGMFLLSPILLALGMGIGPAAEAAFAAPTCARCGCRVEAARPEQAREALTVTASAAHPRAPAVMSAAITRAAA